MPDTAGKYQKKKNSGNKYRKNTNKIVISLYIPTIYNLLKFY